MKDDYYQELWGRAQLLGLKEHDPEQVNTFLHRWVSMLQRGETLPKEEAMILAKMLSDVLGGKDARSVFHPKRADGSRVKKLGNDELLNDLLLIKRSQGTSHQDAIWDLEEETDVAGRTVEAQTRRTRDMNAANKDRMEMLAARDAAFAFRTNKQPDLETACRNFTKKSGLSFHKIYKLAKEI